MTHVSDGVTETNHATAPVLEPLPLPQMMQMITGAWVTFLTGAVVKLGLPDMVNAEPQSAASLAAKVGAPEDRLFRLLRAAAAVGIFTADERGHYTETPLSQILRRDHACSLAGPALYFSDAWHNRGWEHLDQAVLSGRPAFDFVADGQPLFDWFGHHPQQLENFQLGMTNLSAWQSPAVVDAYDFSAFATICDVGGGHGFVLKSILDRYPQARGVLFDLPETIAAAEAHGILAPVRDRVELRGGSMFDEVPAGMDAYIMKYIVHDWSDEHCITFLSHCRQGVQPGGKLLVVDQVVPPGNEFAFSKLMDLEMMVFLTGRERTAAQFENLFAASGWRLTRIIPTEAQLCIMEGEPA